MSLVAGSDGSLDPLDTLSLSGVPRAMPCHLREQLHAKECEGVHVDETTSAHEVWLHAARLRARAAELASLPVRLRREIDDRVDGLHATEVRKQLARRPLADIADVVGDADLLDTLRRLDFHTIGDVLAAPVQLLARVPGCDEEIAQRLVSRADELLDETDHDLPLRLDAERRPDRHTDLLAAVAAFERAVVLVAPVGERLADLVGRLDRLVSAAAPRTDHGGEGRGRDDERRSALSALRSLLGCPTVEALSTRIHALHHEATAPVPAPAALWDDFEARRATIYAILDQHHGRCPIAAAEAILATEARRLAPVPMTKARWPVGPGVVVDVRDVGAA